MKRFLLVFLCIAIAWSCVMPTAALAENPAVSTELSGGFVAGEGSWGVGYVYHSPVKSEYDTTKYPLFIYFPGVGESFGYEKALQAGIGNLTKEEYQQNVAGVHGAYIMQMVGANLHSSDAAHCSIREFVEANPNVDKTRIYVSAWCFGVPFAVNLVTGHPDYYAGLCIYSPFSVILPGRLAALKNTRVWIFGCKTDLLCFYPLSLLAYSSAVLSANDLTNVRLTSVTRAPNKGPGISHYTWKLVYGDADSNSRSGLEGLKTRDGTGNFVELGSIMGWLSEWTTKGTYAPST